MDRDARGCRVALVADEFVNPCGDGFDALPVLEEAGWGVIQLAPSWYPEEVARSLLEQAAEHAHEFARHGYQLLIIGEREGLDQALARLGLQLARLTPTSAHQLRERLHDGEAAEPSVDCRGPTE